MRLVVAIVTAAALVPVALASSSAARPGATQPDHRQGAPGSGLAMPPPVTYDVSIHELGRGQPPGVAWIAGNAIRHRGTRTPLVNATTVSLSTMNGGYLVYERPPGPAAPERIRLIHTGGGSTVLDKGSISEPVVREDGRLASWTTFEPVRQPPGARAPGKVRSRVQTAHAPKGRLDEVSGGPVSDTRYRVVGYLHGHGVVLDSADDSAARAFDADSLTHLSWADTTGVHAASREADIAAFERETNDAGRPCTTTARVDPLLGSTSDLWKSCAIQPISFSPSGRLAVAVDTAEDTAADTAAGPASGGNDADGYQRLHIVAAATGARLWTITVPRTERVSWESDRQLLFDAWDGAGRDAQWPSYGARSRTRAQPVDVNAPPASGQTTPGRRAGPAICSPDGRRPGGQAA